VFDWGSARRQDRRAFQPAPGLPMGYDDLKVIEANACGTAIATGCPG
jgi:hypothetical protein